jgi:hypothetical protein
VTLVITTCTNRKRKPVPDNLHVSSLPQAGVADLASVWGRCLAAASDRFPASEIYGGRGFQEAAAAAELLDARLMVVSAGLGLIFASERVPAYACTVLIDAADSVGARTLGGFDIRGWWKVLTDVSPFSRSLGEIAAQQDGLICAALSDAYIDMIADDLVNLPDAIRSRLRLFTRAPLDRVAAPLRCFVMPYDDRLDGPDSSIRGTRSDFAGRALRHFAGLIGPEATYASASDHAEAVAAAMAGWRMPPRVDRIRHDDAALLDLIRTHWDAENGSSSRLLRRFRDQLGIACEQGRFAALARQVRGERS